MPWGSWQSFVDYFMAGWAGYPVDEVALEKNKHLQGRSNGDDAFSWKNRVAAWSDGRTMVGASDAGAHLDMIDTFSFSTQLLGNAVSKRSLLSVEQAVHHLTGALTDHGSTGHQQTDPLPHGGHP